LPPETVRRNCFLTVMDNKSN